MAAGYKAHCLRRPLVRLNRCHMNRLTRQWWSNTKSHLQVVAKHRALYESRIGSGAARIYCSKYVRRSGIAKGGIFGRAVYLVGCILGGELAPLFNLMRTGAMTEVPFSKPAEEPVSA